MKLGIRFSDNDFTSYVRGFFEMFIVPTFKEVEPGHFTTYLTSAMVVELFNTHMPYVHRFMSWYYDTYHKYHYPESHINSPLHEWRLSKEWLRINEMNVYWDDKTDAFVSDWSNSNNNSEFTWTDGKQVYIS